MAPLDATLARLHRQHYREILAPLIRVLGSFELAEEVVQDAFVQAMAAWKDELPDEPLAWLKRVAKNRAIDQHRRAGRWRDRERVLAETEPRAFEASFDAEALPDDELRLIFTCCHPALAPEARIALTLRTVCGLTSDEVARAFLLKTTTLQQRLVRAQKKIDAAGIPYVIPDRSEIPERLDSVLRTIYLVFNEGYGATEGDVLVRRELCDEAIRLARLVCSLVPDTSASLGLLALLLLHHSRRDARVDARGELVTLEDQDRTRWDRALIDEALPLVDAALRARPVATYAIEAAISALHARAATPDATDWPQIVQLYGALYERSNGNPVVALNAAVARAMAGEPDEALATLDALDVGGLLAGYHLLPAARAELLRRAERLDEARAAYDAALSLVTNPVERRHLERRRASLA
ncbi:MAG: sigma-70 family RNA polymerase sigma factor [Sandaracinus sp.]|nr:sigma-70 family RNA polymerase sigma factor [Sandaracinus sp.]MCB9615751.1 sigma-70 family RNA polymerase sigma factor [Sandaracinus sp.]MCB9623999.1 sigma-70 family RNA polymerase sigma factor [Sandaracinus sp.]MCB9631164.1 sigma-70 family RNA polymerase sigma factor [Sandaracinus sp.]